MSENGNFEKGNQEKAAKYLDMFMGAVNADHMDVIPISRERGCLMRDEIIRLREVESFLESWNKSRRIIDGLTAPIQEKLDLEEKLRALVDEWNSRADACTKRSAHGFEVQHHEGRALAYATAADELEELLGPK